MRRSPSGLVDRVNVALGGLSRSGGHADAHADAGVQLAGSGGLLCLRSGAVCRDIDAQCCTPLKQASGQQVCSAWNALLEDGSFWQSLWHNSAAEAKLFKDWCESLSNPGCHVAPSSLLSACLARSGRLRTRGRCLGAQATTPKRWRGTGRAKSNTTSRFALVACLLKCRKWCVVWDCVLAGGQRGRRRN